MQTIEYRYLDRHGWGVGPWQDEPDKIQWQDETTGYPCLIVRVPRQGHLCGYVGVPPGHQFYEKVYKDCHLPDGEYLDCHGGLTFSGFCSPHPDAPERGICHVVEAGEEDRVWWLGFDCSHLGDLAPGHNRYEFMDREGDQYCTVAYVRWEVTALARQLKSLEDE